MANSGIPYEIHPRPIPGQPQAAPPPHSYEAPDDDLFDWEKIRRYLVFSLGSVRRRFGLFMTVAGSMVLFAAAALWALPKTYEVESRLLAQKSAVLAVKADASQATDPTRSAAEIIVRHENLHALIQQTDLISEWPKHRAPILRLKDWISAKMGKTPDASELTKGLTGLLENNLTVWATPDGAVVIRLRWPDDRVMAYRLVDAAQQNFLEMRHVLEVSTIAEQISILEGHAANLKKEIMKQVEQLQQAQQRSAKDSRPVVRAPAPKVPDVDVVNLRVMLEAKRRALTDLEDYRRRHLTELQTRLSEQRAVYSESHPAIIDLEQSIESLKRESPQLAALRQEEGDLKQQLSRLDLSETAPSAALSIPADLFRDRGEDSNVEYERAQLRFAAQQYAHMRERIDAGRIDLDTARAAFKYRYSVVVPAQVPRGPIKPKALLVMVAALIAGILLALFATTATDFRSGVVLETWQLQNLLGPGQPVIEVRSP